MFLLQLATPTLNSDHNLKEINQIFFLQFHTNSLILKIKSILLL